MNKELHMKRFLLGIGSLGLVALLGITTVGGAVRAQTATPSDGTTTISMKKDQFLNTLAGKLGVSTDQLQTALAQTTDELGFGPGSFAERVRERIQDRLETHRDRVLDRRDLTQAADFLGIPEDQLRAELQGGKTFIEVARAHGKTDDQIRAFLIERATAAIDDHLETATDGSGAPTGA
jgi:hypothetical protein